jgi:hypothetical protein
MTRVITQLHVFITCALYKASADGWPTHSPSRKSTDKEFSLGLSPLRNSHLTLPARNIVVRFVHDPLGGLIAHKTYKTETSRVSTVVFLYLEWEMFNSMRREMWAVHISHALILTSRLTCCLDLAIRNYYNLHDIGHHWQYHWLGTVHAVSLSNKTSRIHCKTHLNSYVILGREINHRYFTTSGSSLI